MKRLLLCLLLLGGAVAADDDACLSVWPPDSCINDEQPTGVSVIPEPPLSANTVSCYDFNESAGATRVDGCGSNDLTEGTGTNVTVGSSAPAVEGNWVQPGLTSCLAGSAIDLGQEWTLNVWATKPGINVWVLTNGALWIKNNVDYEGNNLYQVEVNGISNPNHKCFVVEPADSNMHMFTVWYHPSDHKLHCSLDAGPEHIAKAKIQTFPTLTGSLRVGGDSFGCGTLNTRVDQLSVWSRALGAGSRTLLLTNYTPY